MKTLTQFLFTLLALTFASTTLAATSLVGATPGSFAVSPSGAATYSIPIQVPPGVGGMQPNISLSYNSQGGNGIAGVGWGIGGLSAITRCGATIDRDGFKGGVNLDWNDKYCLDGQRLIAISATEYRTEIESFSKVVATGTQGNGPMYFTVTSKNGVTTEYGLGNGAQQFAQGNGTVLNWHVSTIKDVVGNYVQFVYTADSATSGEHRIDHIDYTYNGTAFVGGTQRRVQFNYGARTDVETGYVGGGAVRTSQRLTSVQTSVGAATSFVRSYNLGYDPSTATQRSRLASVQECTWETAWVCLSQATTLGWLQNAPAVPDLSTQTNWTSGEPALNGYQFLTGDFDGDGRTDVLGIGTVDDYGRYTGSGCLFVRYGGSSLSQQVNWACNESTWINYKFLTGDFNGDGKTDVLGIGGVDIYGHYTGSGCLFVRYGGVNLSQQTSWACNQAAWNGYQFQTGDFDGDGRTDILGIGGVDQYGRYTGSGCLFVQYGGVNLSQQTNWACNQASWNGYQFQTGDFDGDGRTDVLGIGGVDQYGRYTGSGCLFVQYGGVNLSQQTNWACNQASWNGYQFQTGDFDGDGRTDVLGIGSVDTTNRYIGAGAIFLRYSLSKYPNTITTITNGLGSQTTLTYKPLTDSSVYTKETAAAYPVKDEQTPMYVVSAVSSSNGLGGVNTANYSYTGMKEHQTGRGNLGFHTMSVTGPDGSVSTTTFAQTWPFIGMPVESSTKVYNSSTSTWVTVGYQQNHLSSAEWTATIWNNVSLVPSYTSSAAPPATPALTPPTSALLASGACTFADPTRTCLPFVDWSYSLSKDFGANTAFSASLTDSSNPDRYGNVTTGTATSYDGYKTVTTSYFSNDTANWRLGWGVASQVSSTVPLAYSNTGAAQTQVRTTLNNYDTLGRLIRTVVQPEAGTFTLSTGVYVAPSVGPFTALVTEYGYDATYGYQNAVTVKGGDIATRTTSTAYVNSTNPGSLNPQIRTTNALTHTETTTYDARFGVPLSTTGPNGLVTTWTYDGFGRKVKELRADGTATTVELPGLPLSSLTDYGINGLSLSADIGYARYSSTTRVLNSSGTDMAPSVTVYYDMLGRELRSETQGFNSSKKIFKDTAYDNLGRVKKVSRPYFEYETVVWTKPEYDALGRAFKVTAFDGTAQAATTETTYDKFSTTVTAPYSDGLTRKRTEVKNSQGQVVSVTDALNGVITYKYDAFGNLGKVTTTGGTDTKTATITSTFDIRGRKTAMNDPDMGAWSYTYDVLGELLTQKDAKLQTATMTYDVLGRMTKRVEVEGTSTWTYDTAANGKGKLASVTGPTNSYARSYVYDSLGRPAIVGTSINAVLYNMSVGYDTGTGRVTNVQFPSTVTGFGNFAFYNNYDTKGFLTAVSSLANNGGTKYWQLDTDGIDAEGRVISETMGNSTQTKRTYNPISDLLSDINTTGPTSTTVQSSNYTYFTGVPNLNTRSSTVVGYNYTETFAYDALNRVLSANITGGASKSFGYDSLGNIIAKTGVGTVFTYGSATVRPHAVTSVTGTVNGVVNPTYSYDANGNQTIGAGRTLGYTSFNVPKSVTMAAISQSYAYDAEHQRIVMTEGAANTTTYINPRWDAGTHFEKEKKGNIDEYKHYIYAGGRPVAMYVVKRDNGTGINSTYTRYLHTDHLGSVDVITKEDGSIAERLGYDTWGKRRNANGTDSATQLTSTVDHHGYTGHEMNDSIGLINMNGRWYDPTLGRFMQADPSIDGMANLQGYNRYSYVANNPLSGTDPSGFKKFWHKKWFKKAVIVIAVVAVTIYTGGAAASLITANFSAGALTTIAAGAVQGAVGGAIIGGALGYSATGTMNGFWQGASSGAITGAIGGGLGAGINVLSSMSGSWSGVVEGVGRSVVSGISSKISGGSFEKGFTTGIALAGAAAAYKAYVGYGIDPKPGGDAVIKYGPEDGGGAAVEGANNVGNSRTLAEAFPKDANGVQHFVEPDLFDEGGGGSRFLNKIPTGNSLAGLHDTLMGTVESLIGKGPATSFLNAATIFPAMAVNSVATLSLMPEAAGYVASHSSY